MKFCDMPYERIDVKAATAALDAAAEHLAGAKTLGEAEAAFEEREKIITHVHTMSTIAYIATPSTPLTNSMRKKTTSTTGMPR